ncbi:MAG: biotin/lipoate A/B protein ligase family protein [Nanoarchaeota archaeon]|nr:biotin/lipoate A/B protein ligase family protein [Nanoarchaeota archaeon]
MKWRLIEQETYSAGMNMAIDHAIYESIVNGRELPTIRFYKWIPSSISLGAYQNPNEINLEACKRHGIGLVRRMTGGRAVFHDKVDFTYSVIAPIKVFDFSIENAYRQICSWIINALNELGINATLENKNDIVVDGKKISGNAAKAMEKGVYLQHGTLIYDIDFGIMPEVLNISKDSVKERATSILQHKQLSQQEVYYALKNNFIRNKESKMEKLSKFELMRAQDLAKTKYSTIMLPLGTLLKNKGACYVERG